MMRTLAVAAFAIASLTAAAAANDVADQCRAYVAENGGDDSGCGCLGEAAAADAALADAISAIETPADLEAADDATKSAIAACFPDSQEG